MARLDRVVDSNVSIMPRSAAVAGTRPFFDTDYTAYRDQLAESCAKAGVSVRASCLMPNYVHLILVPSTPSSCARHLPMPTGCASSVPSLLHAAHSRASAMPLPPCPQTPMSRA
jgi:hypothetical protein